MELKPHDLIHIREVEGFLQGFPFPDWVGGALRQAPWVVVRRSAPMPDQIPVGIRGKERGQRFAAWINADHVIRVVPPIALIDPAGWNVIYDVVVWPMVKGLLAASLLLRGAGYQCGPTGSFGFELASGIPSTHPESDLDILVEVSRPIGIAKAHGLLAAMEALSPVRLDIQMSTPAGGVSWREYCAADEVLVKTNSGPVLRKKEMLWD
jgi:phosphoribosyl-dephospho-CoA transferase